MPIIEEFGNHHWYQWSYNGIWSENHWHQWFCNGFWSEPLVPIVLHWFLVEQPMATMVFQWFQMVAIHWSSDGMVTIRRHGLPRGVAFLKK